MNVPFNAGKTVLLPRSEGIPHAPAATSIKNLNFSDIYARSLAENASASALRSASQDDPPETADSNHHEFSDDTCDRGHLPPRRGGQLVTNLDDDSALESIEFSALQASSGKPTIQLTIESEQSLQKENFVGAIKCATTGRLHSEKLPTQADDSECIEHGGEQQGVHRPTKIRSPNELDAHSSSIENAAEPKHQSPVMGIDLMVATKNSLQGSNAELGELYMSTGRRMQIDIKAGELALQSKNHDPSTILTSLASLVGMSISEHLGMITPAPGHPGKTAATEPDLESQIEGESFPLDHDSIGLNVSQDFSNFNNIHLGSNKLFDIRTSAHAGVSKQNAQVEILLFSKTADTTGFVSDEESAAPTTPTNATEKITHELLEGRHFKGRILDIGRLSSISFGEDRFAARHDNTPKGHNTTEGGSIDIRIDMLAASATNATSLSEAVSEDGQSTVDSFKFMAGKYTESGTGPWTVSWHHGASSTPEDNAIIDKILRTTEHEHLHAPHATHLQTSGARPLENLDGYAKVRNGDYPIGWNRPLFGGLPHDWPNALQLIKGAIISKCSIYAHKMGDTLAGEAALLNGGDANTLLHVGENLEIKIQLPSEYNFSEHALSLHQDSSWRSAKIETSHISNWQFRMPNGEISHPVKIPQDSLGSSTNLSIGSAEFGAINVEIFADADSIAMLVNSEHGETQDILRRHAADLGEEISLSDNRTIDLSFGSWGERENGGKDPDPICCNSPCSDRDKREIRKDAQHQIPAAASNYFYMRV